MIIARSSEFCTMRSYHRRNARPRSLAGTARQDTNAAFAALMASKVASSDMSGTVPRKTPFPGSTTFTTPEAGPETNSPLINAWSRTSALSLTLSIIGNWTTSCHARACILRMRWCLNGIGLRQTVAHNEQMLSVVVPNAGSINSSESCGYFPAAIPYYGLAAG